MKPYCKVLWKYNINQVINKWNTTKPKLRRFKERLGQIYCWELKTDGEEKKNDMQDKWPTLKTFDKNPNLIGSGSRVIDP